MSSEETDRTVVKTYVPASQKEEWQSHAEQLDMSQSEFVRTMVQAGRRGFDLDSTDDDEEVESTTVAEGGPDLEDRVVAILQDGTYSWDELLAAVTNDVEDRLEDALQELQARNEIVYSGRDGGYSVVN